MTTSQPPYETAPTQGEPAYVPHQGGWGAPAPVGGAPVPPAASAATAWYRRHWVQLVIVGIVGLGVGSAIGNSSAAESEAKAERALADVAQIRITNSGLVAERDEAVAAADKAKAEAQAELKVEAGALAKGRADLAAAKKSQEAALAKREQAVTGLEAEAKANEFEGEGIYRVPEDVKPGTYKAEAAGDNCYWARLSSLDTSDINDNGNTTGPVVLQVRASDRAIEVSGCSTFRKVG